MNNIIEETTTEKINREMMRAMKAFTHYKQKSGKEKAAFLWAIADEIEALGDDLIKIAHQETNLPEARLLRERSRTTSQLKMFARLIEEGTWVDAIIDTAIYDREPSPRPDLRRILIPLGPVVVFGSSNFPFAFSTSGGDTASALAAGCPVVMKAHPGHTNTSNMVANAIIKAIKETDMPDGVFVHIHGGISVGSQLVQHPLTSAVAFTGSKTGGMALFELGAKRSHPIPVFAEMGSINPIILLPGALQENAEAHAKIIAASITQGVGQFCTNPGLLLNITEKSMDNFISLLGNEIRQTIPTYMVHEGIAKNYQAKKDEVLAQKGIKLEATGERDLEEGRGLATIASVTARDYLHNSIMHEEVFGPYSLIVKCEDKTQLIKVISNMEGQLTTTIIGNDNDLAVYKDVIGALEDISGRIIINGVPTGVEVCGAMHHGGPYPATTDARFTSVGTEAIKRFVRPICYQDFPDKLLPAELKNDNPLNIIRKLNNVFTRDKIISKLPTSSYK